MKCPLYDKGNGCEADDPIDPAGVPPGYYKDCRYVCCGDGMRAARSKLSKPTNKQLMEVNGIKLTVAPFRTQHKPEGRFVVVEPVVFRGRIVLVTRDKRRIFSVQKVR